MAVQLTFEGDVIGDHFINEVPLDLLLSPPAKRVGLYHAKAAINADSRNYLYGRQFKVVMERGNPVLLMQALQSIEELKGQTGDIQVTFGANTETMSAWTIDDVSVTNLPDGFGGRYADAIMITAYGATRPVYA
ncbi:MAG: hypothetical protein H6819_06675 [Phycisphaerales bacterium]|nr:hypothetical protein [Phycisphaerales bacterium]MCB9855265.1 hypothetical protein [Phycisphaerales bacterium]MCB9862858.1 hypothetical protein [Phycisphaerales bacterium]